MPKTSTKKNKGTNAMSTQTNKVASVDNLQRNNNITNKADKPLPCTNSSENADDMLYSKTAAEVEQSKNKKNYESKIDSKYTFGYSDQKSNDEDDDDNEEEEMDACTFEIPIATSKNKMPSSSRTSSLPFDLHGAERLRREFLFSFGRLNQHKRSMRTHTNQGFASNSGSASKLNVNCDMSNDDDDDDNIQQQHHVISKNNEQDDDDEDEEEDDDEELNEYDDNVRHIAALRGMLTDEELFRAFFEPLSYTFDSGSRDDTEEGYHYTNSNWQRRRMEQNSINDRFHRVEVIDDNEQEDEDEDDEEERESKNILHSHKTTTSCSKQNNTNTNSATNSSMEDNTITFSSHTCLDDSCKCKNDNVVHSTESANTNTTTTVYNGNKLSSTNMKVKNNQSTYNNNTHNANNKSSLKELSHWSEAEQQQKEEQEEEETRQDDVGTTKSKNDFSDSNDKVKSKIKEILTLEDVLRCTSMEYSKDNNDNNKEKGNTARSRNKVLKNLNKLRGVEMHNSKNEESETNKDNHNNNNNNENQNDEQPIDLSNIDLDDEGSMYVMQRLLDFLQQTMDNSECDMDKDEMDGHTGNVDDDMNKIKNNYNNKDKIMCERSNTNTDKSNENYHLHPKRSYYKFNTLENEEFDRAEQVNTNEEDDQYEDEYDDEDDDDDDDVNDIYFSSLGLHNKRNIRSNPWESQRTLNSPLDKKVHFTYQTNTSKRDNSKFIHEEQEEEDKTDFDVEEAHNIQQVNNSNTNKGGRSTTNNNKSNKYYGTSAAEAEDMRALLSAIRHRHYTSFAHKSNDRFDDDDDKLNYLNDKLTANNYAKSKSDVKNNLETEVAAGTAAITKAKVSSSPLCGDESDALTTANQLLSGASKTNTNHATSRQGSKMKFSGEQYFCLRNEAAFNPCSSTSLDFSNDPKRSITTTTTSTSSKARFTPAALPEDWTAQLASYFADDSFTVASSTSALDVLMNEPAERSTRHCKSKKQGKECKSSVFDIISMNAASCNTGNNNKKNRERSLEHSNEYEEETNAAYSTQQAEKNVKNTKYQTSSQNDNALQDCNVHDDLHNVEKESQNKIDKTSNEQQEENDDDNNNKEVTASESDNHFRVRKRTRSTMMMQQRTISELREKMSILSLFSKETLQRLARQVHKVELPRDLLLNFMPLSLEDSSVAMVAYRLCEAGKAVAASLWWYKEVKSIMAPTSSSKSSLEKFDGNNAAQAVTSLASSQTRLTEEKRLELQSILHVNYNKLHSALRLLSCDGLKALISLLPQLGLITNEDVYGMVNTIAAILFFHTLPPSLLQEICAELAISTSDEANMDWHVLPQTLAEKIGNYLYPTPERVRISLSQLPFLPKLQIHESGSSFLCTIDNASNLCRLPYEHYLSNRFNCTEESSKKNHKNGSDEAKQNKGGKIKWRAMLCSEENKLSLMLWHRHHKAVKVMELAIKTAEPKAGKKKEKVNKPHPSNTNKNSNNNKKGKASDNVDESFRINTALNVSSEYDHIFAAPGQSIGLRHFIEHEMAISSTTSMSYGVRTYNLEEDKIVFQLHMRIDSVDADDPVTQTTHTNVNYSDDNKITKVEEEKQEEREEVQNVCGIVGSKAANNKNTTNVDDAINTQECAKANSDVKNENEGREEEVEKESIDDRNVMNTNESKINEQNKNVNITDDADTASLAETNISSRTVSVSNKKQNNNNSNNNNNNNNNNNKKKNNKKTQKGNADTSGMNNNNNSNTNTLSSKEQANRIKAANRALIKIVSDETTRRGAIADEFNIKIRSLLNEEQRTAAKIKQRNEDRERKERLAQAAPSPELIKEVEELSQMITVHKQNLKQLNKERNQETKELDHVTTSLTNAHKQLDQLQTTIWCNQVLLLELEEEAAACAIYHAEHAHRKKLIKRAKERKRRLSLLLEKLKQQQIHELHHEQEQEEHLQHDALTMAEINHNMNVWEMEMNHDLATDDEPSEFVHELFDQFSSMPPLLSSPPMNFHDEDDDMEEEEHQHQLKEEEQDEEALLMCDNMHCSFPQMTDMHDDNMIDHMEHFILSDHTHNDIYPNDLLDHEKEEEEEEDEDRAVAHIMTSTHEANTTNSFHSLQSGHEVHLSHSVPLSTTPDSKINQMHTTMNNNNVYAAVSSQPHLPHQTATPSSFSSRASQSVFPPTRPSISLTSQMMATNTTNIHPNFTSISHSTPPAVLTSSSSLSTPHHTSLGLPMHLSQQQQQQLQQQQNNNYSNAHKNVNFTYNGNNYSNSPTEYYQEYASLQPEQMANNNNNYNNHYVQNNMPPETTSMYDGLVNNAQITNAHSEIFYSPLQQPWTASAAATATAIPFEHTNNNLSLFEKENGKDDVGWTFTTGANAINNQVMFDMYQSANSDSTTYNDNNKKNSAEGCKTTNICTNINTSKIVEQEKEEEVNMNVPIATPSSVHSLHTFSTQPRSFTSAMAHNYELAQTPPLTNVNDMDEYLKAAAETTATIHSANKDQFIQVNTEPAAPPLHKESLLHNLNSPSTHLLFSSNTNNIARAFQQSHVDYASLYHSSAQDMSAMTSSSSSPFSTNPMLHQNTALLYHQQQQQQQQQQQLQQSELLKVKRQMDSGSPLTPPTLNIKTNIYDNENEHNNVLSEQSQYMCADDKHSSSQTMNTTTTTKIECPSDVQQNNNTSSSSQTSTISNSNNNNDISKKSVHSHMSNNNSNDNSDNQQSSKMDNLSSDVHCETNEKLFRSLNEESHKKFKLREQHERGKLTTLMQQASFSPSSLQSSSVTAQTVNELYKTTINSNFNISNNDHNELVSERLTSEMEAAASAFAYQPTFSTAPFSLAQALMHLQSTNKDEAASASEANANTNTNNNQFVNQQENGILPHNEMESSTKNVSALSHYNVTNKQYNNNNITNTQTRNNNYNNNNNNDNNNGGSSNSSSSHNNLFNVVNGAPLSDYSLYSSSSFNATASPFTLAGANVSPPSIMNVDVATAAAINSNQNNTFHTGNENAMYDPMANMNAMMSDAGIDYTQLYSPLFSGQIHQPLQYGDTEMHLPQNLQNFQFATYTPQSQNDLVDYNTPRGWGEYNPYN